MSAAQGKARQGKVCRRLEESRMLVTLARGRARTWSTAILSGKADKARGAELGARAGHSYLQCTAGYEALVDAARRTGHAFLAEVMEGEDCTGGHSSRRTVTSGTGRRTVPVAAQVVVHSRSTEPAVLRTEPTVLTLTPPDARSPAA